MTGHAPNQFLVICLKDFDNLSRTNRNLITGVMEKIKRDRERAGLEPEPQYYVCNRAEPYAMDVLNAILRGEERKELTDE